MSNKYDSYKDSEIEWIGMIPEKWSYSALKWYALIYSGGTPSKDIEDYWINGTIPWLNSGVVNQGDVIEASEFITEEALKKSSAKWVPNDSLIMALAGQGKTKGMVAQVKFNTTCNQSLGVIVPNEKIDNRYLLYWLRNNYQNIRNLGGGDKRDGLNLVMLGSIPIPIPNIKEQNSISNYLDHKTTQIDNLIAKKEQFIQLLEEERVAVINQAVTKGLDPTVPMKDSGIEWLGEIPEHWEVILFKRVISKIKDGTHGTFQRLSEGYPFLSAKNVYDDGLKISETESLIGENDYLEITKNGFPKRNDLLITCVGTIGRTFVYDLDEPFAFQRSVTFIRFNENINPHYYKFYVQSSIYQNLLISIAKTSAQSGIYMNDLMNTFALKTPLNEQNKIVEFLKIKTHEIDEIILKAQHEILLLKEYKTALISEVVTGKVDVREEIINQQVAI